MTERAYREGYAMHSVKAREQLVCTYHKLGSIHAATTYPSRDRQGAAQSAPQRTPSPPRFLP
ncbi:MAG: hypothetical protein DDG58_04030, partial [Ardenticatenia bacterium]